MNKILLGITFASLGLLAGTMLPRSHAQTSFAWPHTIEYTCVDGIPGRNNLENFLAVLNAKGAEGWRYIGQSPVAITSTGYCFERGR